MPTLKQIATEVAFDLNRPFDNNLINRVGAIIMQEAAKFLRQSIEKNGTDVALIQTYIENLIPVDISVDTSIVDVGINLLRTENKIHIPLRTKSDSPFQYVGSVDYKVPIPYSPGYSSRFDSHLPLVGARITYDVQNGYLYLYRVKKMKYLAIRSVFENPMSVLQELESGNTGNTDGFCVDDHAFPVPMDIISDIKKSLLSGELRVTDEKDKVEATHLDTV